MKIIQVVDGADNATFSLFQATEEEFALLFPGDGQNMVLVEDIEESAVSAEAFAALDRIWNRPILKRDAHGLHGTLFYDNDWRRPHIPASRREADTPSDGLNEAQRRLFEARR